MILLVEDNPDDETLTRRALAKNNIQNEVRVARDGAEALQLLQSITPEVVLLDLKLPKVDGLEVLRRLRAAERTRLLPVVINWLVLNEPPPSPRELPRGGSG